MNEDKAVERCEPESDPVELVATRSNDQTGGQSRFSDD